MFAISSCVSCEPHHSALLDACNDGGGDALQYGGERALRIAEEMRRMGPWWDRNPRTHIFPMTTDTGICEVGEVETHWMAIDPSCGL